MGTAQSMGSPLDMGHWLRWTQVRILRLSWRSLYVRQTLAVYQPVFPSHNLNRRTTGVTSCHGVLKRTSELTRTIRCWMVRVVFG